MCRGEDALFITTFLESWGTGVSRMVDACKAVGLLEPKYGTDGAFVWITFKRPSRVANLDTNLDTNSDTNTPLNITDKCNTSHNQHINSDTYSVSNLDTNLDTNSDGRLLLSDRQKEVLRYCIFPRSSKEILEHIGVISHQKNRERFINTLVDAGLLDRTQPDSPNSPNQRYVVKRK